AGAHLAPGALRRKIAAGRDALGRDLRPVAFELLGDELGEAGERALPHLGACDADDAGVVGLYRDPDADFAGFALSERLALERHAESEREAAACSRSADHEFPSGEVLALAECHLSHGALPQPLLPVVEAPAAMCTAS